MRDRASRLSIYRDISSDQFVARLLKRENGKLYFGKVSTEWIEYQPGEILPNGGASFLVEQVDDVTPVDQNGRYEELKKGSADHINNLNNIIDVFMTKCLK